MKNILFKTTSPIFCWCSKELKSVHGKLNTNEIIIQIRIYQHTGMIKCFCRFGIGFVNKYHLEKL